MAEALVVGQEAPDFSLKNEPNEDVVLKELRGKPVVLVFYALGWSPVCDGEMCGYRDDYPELEARGAGVLGINRDSAWGLKAWRDYLGLAECLTVLINGGGIVRHIERSPDLGTARDHTQTLAALKSL